MSHTPSESTELSRKSEAFQKAQLSDGESRTCFKCRCSHQNLLQDPTGLGSADGCDVTYEGRIVASQQRDLLLPITNDIFENISHVVDNEEEAFKEFVSRQSNIPANCPRHR